MTFKTQYNEIKDLIKDDFDILENEIETMFAGGNPLDEKLLSFLTAPSKRLRPMLGFLFLRAALGNLGELGELNQSQRDVLLAVELIHNATLIHDDVIDNSSKRRNQETLNAEFDNNLAVVAGDFLLSISLEKIIKTKSFEVFEIFSSALKSACLGEISQYFNKFNLITIDEYIEKSKEKTAFLFEAAVLGGLILSEDSDNKELRQAAEDFSQNFGIAFQVRDDLINVLKSDDLKPSQNDMNSGIYTAPVIFAYEGQESVNVDDNIPDRIKTTNAIAKTKDLMDNYFHKSILALEDLENNDYKRAILKLINLLKTNI